MAVFYKFKSEKKYHSVPINGTSISVASLKEAILRSNRYRSGLDSDLIISNAQSNEDYVEDDTMIHGSTSVLIRRLTEIARNPIITGMDKSNDKEAKLDGIKRYGSTNRAFDNYATMKGAKESERDDEDAKIKALVDTPALDWSWKDKHYGAARSFVWRRDRVMTGHGLGHHELESAPPAGYVCHRCNFSGHFINDCPTKNDRNYDIKRVKLPTGIPKSMLVETPDGTYQIPGGAIVSLQPDEAAFEKEVMIPVLTSCANDMPPEFFCPLCNKVMEDSVLSGKCCFRSYCDKCIRTYIISMSKCFCGATNILVDYLVPNITIRNIITRILGSRTSSVEKYGSSLQVKDSSMGGLEQSSLAGHSSDLKELVTHTQLTVKQPEKDTIAQMKEACMNSSAKEEASVKKVTQAPDMKNRKRKNRDGEKCNAVHLNSFGCNDYTWADWIPIANGRCMPPLLL